MHLVIVHTPPVHVPVLPVNTQALPQAPQFSRSVAVEASQPLPVTASQLAQPDWQLAIAQEPAWQLGFA
jgi:hypothetical protein